MDQVCSENVEEDPGSGGGGGVQVPLPPRKARARHVYGDLQVQWRSRRGMKQVRANHPGVETSPPAAAVWLPEQTIVSLSVPWYNERE